MACASPGPDGYHPLQISSLNNCLITESNNIFSISSGVSSEATKLWGLLVFEFAVPALP